MKKPVIAVLVAAVLGLGGVVGIGASSAEAHVPAVSATCAGVVVHGTNYDGNKLNTWEVNIGGVEQSGTFGYSVDKTFPVPQSGATTHVTASIADADHTPAYSQSIDLNVGPCGEVPKPDVTHRVTDTNGPVVCKPAGGGTYVETITHYTTNPVWNAATGKYDLVETVDAGYPQTVTHNVQASREKCPFYVVPVKPSVTAVCDKQDTVTLAHTVGIVYQLVSHSDKGATVKATAAANTLLTASKGWVLSNNKVTATYRVIFDNSACIMPANNVGKKLAFTGDDPTFGLSLAGGTLGFGLPLLFLVRRAKKRWAAEEAEQI